MTRSFLISKIFPLFFLLGLTSLILTSCKDDDDEPTPSTSTITDVVVNGADFSLLEAALVRVSTGGGSDLVGLLDGTTDYTVFAPTNAAFQAAGFANEAAINAADVATLEEILTYHVLAGEFLSSALSSGARETANGDDIYLSVNGSNIFINGSTQVTSANVVAGNGVIHVINKVLIPASQDVTEIAIEASEATTPEFGSLVAALTQAGLVDDLQAAGPFTVFAPTDAAFEEFLGQLGLTLDQVPDELLSQILLYHVVSGRVFSSDLTNGATPATLNGATVRVNLTGGVFIESLNQSEVTAADILATNGVIHQIDKVLVPIEDFTIAQIAQVGDDFTLLEAAAGAAGLVDDLNNGTNLTVFAPNDDAFAATNLDAAALAGLTTAQAEEIIGYHALTEEKLAADFGTGGPETTLAGLDIFVNVTANGVFINPSNPGQNIRVTTANVQAKNGVIHIIEKVILPPSLQFPENGTVTDLVVKLATDNPGEFTQLLAAILRVDSTIANSNEKLANVLGSNGPFTVFAPTDAAFQALYTKLGVTSVSQIDAATLKAVLLYHVVQANAKVYSTDLTAGTVTMLDGNNITISLSNGVTITSRDLALDLDPTNATVTGANVVASNGVVHIINQVLLP
ncbi:MAG: fasciclin domain-containing protein [Microscillaceae bacterium]|nr:fasciclin domain-containing protein [Microscillaceae bacterium]